MDTFSYGFELINLLRKAPGKPAIWANFLAQLTKYLNCESSFLLVNHVINREKIYVLFHFNMTDKQLNRYINHDKRLDSFNFFLAKNPRQVFCSQELTGGIFSTQLVENHTPPNRLPYRLGFSIPCHHYFLSLHISRHKLFSKQELQQNLHLLQKIIIPFEEAIHAEQQQKIHSQLIHQTEQHFDGYLIVDQQLNIHLIDPVYKLIFKMLGCVDCYKDQVIINNSLLKKALLDKLNNPSEQFEIFNHCCHCQIGLLPVKVLDNLYSWECYKNDFILTFSGNDYQSSTIDRLMNIHQLSKSEALCALHFISTPSITIIAEKTYRSQNTVRNHIKRIMHKMDVHNQAALMKKLIILASL